MCGLGVIRVEVTTTMLLVNGEPAEEQEDLELNFDDDSYACCAECGWDGVVAGLVQD